MNFALRALGAGSALSDAFDNSNFLLSFEAQAEPKHLLFDCGTTAPKIWRRRFEAVDLAGILLTHTHGDHCGGIEEIAFVHKYLLQRKLPLYTQPDVFDRLWNRTLWGGMSASSGDPSAFFTLGLGSFPEILVQAQWHRMQHVASDFPNYGLSFVVNDCLIWISGDTVFTPEMFDHAFWQERYGRDMPDVILHEVFFPEMETKSHALYSSLRLLPEEWKRRMLLYHYDEREVDIEADGFAGYVSAAEGPDSAAAVEVRDGRIRLNGKEIEHTS